MDSLAKTTQKIIQFRDSRDWKKFHNFKDLALSLVLESTELLEHFQWKNESEIKQHIELKKDEIADELADILYWVLLISHDANIDVIDAVEKKIVKNEAKYPIEKAKGVHTKYTDL